ncbi:hypothetical protein ACFWAP_12315 [Streptomyces goshikiensis]|uniref:hypothetical protein n=1 Tax=Streptomyces goshikiensis TaxID=1942 RepID=UPI003663C0C1
MHPLGVRFLLADAFAANLETLPTLVWPDGRRVPEGPPRSDATRHNVLSACSSFYVFLLRTKLLPKEQLDSNPFEAVLYPAIDPLYSRTEAFTQAEFAALLRTARDGLGQRGNRWPTGHVCTPNSCCSTTAACASTRRSAPASNASGRTAATASWTSK